MVKTLKELGIPKGFQLTIKSKSRIIEYVVKDTLEDEGYALSDAEIQLFKNITEYCFPKQIVSTFKESYVAAMSLFNKKFMDYDKPTNHITHIQIRYDAEKTVNIGLEYAWSSDKYTVCNVYSPLSKMYFSKEVHVEVPIWYRKPIALHTLRDDIIIQVHNHVEKCEKFNDKVYKLRSSLSSVLNNYTSVIRLCSDNPEFVQWIRGSLDLEPDPNKCSDIPIADKMQEVKQIIGEVK